MEIRKILIATDFSSNGAIAINYGGSLATLLNAQLVIVHVEDERQKAHSDWKNGFSNYKAYANHHFTRIQEQFLIYKRLNPSYILKSGVASEKILETIEQEGIDLLVIGISGMNRAFEMEFGSVSLKILNQISCPVIVVPETHEKLKLANIAVASDNLIPENETQTAMINYLIDKIDPNVYMIHVSDRGTVQTENYRKLKRKETPFDDHDLEAIDQNEIMTHIINESKMLAADLVVIFRRKKSMTTHAFMPRLSNLIALNSEIPLLYIPCEVPMADDSEG